MQVPPGASGRGQGLRRWQSLEPPERVQGIWCTSPAETLLGLAADLNPRPGCTAASRKLPPADLVELATESALRRGLVSLASLREVNQVEHHSEDVVATLLAALDRPARPGNRFRG